MVLDLKGLSLTSDPTPTVSFYNGVLFSAYTFHEIQGKPVYTSDGRGVKWVEYSIEVKATVAPANQDAGLSTDDTLAQMRVLLQQNGGELQFAFAGFGPLVANVPPAGRTVGLPSTVLDPDFGPKPELLGWAPSGRMAADVHWRCVVKVSECPEPVVEYRGAIVEFITSLTYSISPTSGRTTRTMEGHLHVAGVRWGADNNRVLDHADRFREQIAAALPVPAGFRRSYGPWKLTPAKNVLNFAVIDTEWGGSGDNYPPAGIVEVSASQESQAPGPIGGVCTNTLRATYEVSRDVPRGEARRAFFALFLDRFAQAKQVQFKARRGFGLLTAFSAGEPEIYSREGSRDASFSASWKFLATLSELVQGSGLWRPLSGLAGGDWSRWAASLQNTALHPRGSAKLRYDPSAEAILDICHQGSSRVLEAGGLPRSKFVPTAASSVVFANEVPPADSSWLAFTSTLWLEQDDEVTLLKPLPPTPPPRKPPPPRPRTPERMGPSISSGGTSPGTTGTLPLTGAETPSSSIGFIASGSSGAVPGVPPAQSGPVVQRHAEPTYHVVLKGTAVRAGYRITPPALVSVGGVPGVPDNRGAPGFGEWVIGNYFGVTVIGAAWQIRYLLCGTPSVLPLMDSPFI